MSSTRLFRIAKKVQRRSTAKELLLRNKIFVRYVLIGFECLTRFLVGQDNKFMVILLFIF